MPSHNRILVVDDEFEICKLVARGLEKLGYSVDIALNPSDGAKLAREGHYTVVVSDYRMSDDRYEHGIQLIDDLSLELPVTRFVLLTGRGNDLVQEQAFLNGAVRYIRKEGNFKEICLKIDEVVQREEEKLRLRLPADAKFAEFKAESKKAYFAILARKYRGSAPAISEAAGTCPATTYTYLEKYGIPFKKRKGTRRRTNGRHQGRSSLPQVIAKGDDAVDSS